MSNTRLGLWLDDPRLDIKAGLKAVAPLQPEAIGLDAFGPELQPRSLGLSGRRDLAHLVRSKGTLLAALRADVGGRRLADTGTLDVNLGRLREALQLASDLGAACLVVPAGYLPDEQRTAQGRDAHATGDAAARNALSEAARALAGLAASSRTRVCWLGGGEAPEALAGFLQEEDRGGILEVDLNPGGYVARGLDPLNALRVLSSRVALVRATDHYRGGGEASFGQGDVPWGEVLVGLSALQRPEPIPVLAASTLAGDRLAALSAAYKRLQALRRNPLDF
ncbi:MAG: hypothetical protein NTW87_30370 [Planctomycetota bacterium]|nr:hypothetical protein [Planctomycetota bacterium]